MSHYAEETYAVYDERARTAAKEHRCDACCETILPGHRYYVIGMVWDGEARSYKRCLRCQRIHVHLRALGYDNELWPDERLDCGETYEAHWGVEPPPEIAALAFATPAELQGEAFGDATAEVQQQMERKLVNRRRS
jgi:hypothetical protein